MNLSQLTRLDELLDGAARRHPTAAERAARTAPSPEPADKAALVRASLAGYRVACDGEVVRFIPSNTSKGAPAA